MSTLVLTTELRVFYHRREHETVLVGRLAYDRNTAVFQYDASFRDLRLELSPFKMRVADGLLRARPDQFEGLFGLFDDSLPDGWGRLLLDRHLQTRGLGRAPLTPLDRLAWVGDRAIGALSYEPAHSLPADPEQIDLHALGAETRIVLEDGASEALEQLLRLGGSPQGARPKVLVLVSADGQQIIAGSEARDDFEPYLVKFLAKDDSTSTGAIEFAYSQMARAAGLEMPETRLLARRDDHPGFFAIRRFDRDGARRVHSHTVSGLLSAPPYYTVVSYDDVLRLTWALTKDARQVKELFRRAAFNVFAHNRDDHSKNISFLMDPSGSWTLAPAYDLTFSAGPGGEHTMTVAGEGRSPTAQHLLALAKGANISKGEAQSMIDRVRSACADWPRIAEECAVPAADRARIARATAP